MFLEEGVDSAPSVQQMNRLKNESSTIDTLQTAAVSSGDCGGLSENETMEKKSNKQTHRQNGWSHKGPADSPESVGLKTNHHFDVRTKPLQTCTSGRQERRRKIKKREK